MDYLSYNRSHPGVGKINLKTLCSLEQFYAHISCCSQAKGSILALRRIRDVLPIPLQRDRKKVNRFD